jgi:hypothetical protein
MVSDPQLLEALRKRMLRDIESPSHGVNVNVGNVSHGTPYGIHGAMSQNSEHISDALTNVQATEKPDDFEYYVDIDREDKAINPETGKPSGWKKSVHWFRSPLGKEPPKKKVLNVKN